MAQHMYQAFAQVYVKRIDAQKCAVKIHYHGLNRLTYRASADHGKRIKVKLLNNEMSGTTIGLAVVTVMTAV